MMRAFLLVGMLIGSTALNVAKKEGEKAEKKEGDAAVDTSVDAKTREMRARYEDAEVATDEAIKRCKAYDFAGTKEVLEAHSRPLGHEKSKKMLKACYYDEAGTCLVGEVQCKWMQECFATDGPCHQPPIKDIFLEIPGGEVLLQSLRTAEVDPKELQSLVQTTQEEGKPKVAVPNMLPPGFVSQAVAYNLYGLSMVAGTLNNMIPEQARYNLLLAKMARDGWLQAVPDKKKRKWFYELASLANWFIMACGTEYNTVKMTGVGGATKPIYAWFAPMGLFKSPAYTSPVLDTKILKWDEWKC